jgi:hypothetical protein
MDPQKFPKAEALHKFLYDYYLPTWFGTGGERARISADMWNHGRYGDEDELLQTPKTTNALESWHRTLNAMGNREDKRFWTIYLGLRKELGEAARQKFTEFASKTQNRRALGASQKKANKLVEMMHDFDTNNVPKSLTALARASQKVKVVTHPAIAVDPDITEENDFYD